MVNIPALPKISDNIDDQEENAGIARYQNGEAVTKRAERRVKSMETERERFVPVWREITNYVAPNRGVYDNEKPNQGNRRDYYLLDTMPTRALNLLQSGIQGGLTSPSLDWFKLAIGDAVLNKDVEVRQWMDDCHDIMMDELSRSNIYNCLYGIYGEVGAFGIGAMMMEDDVKTGRLIGKLFTAGQYSVSYDNSGLPSAFAYTLWMTAEQIRDKFGQNALDFAVLEALRQNSYDQPFEVTHLIQSDPQSMDKLSDNGFKFASIYWRPGKEQHLRIGGFEECPVFAPRWEAIGSDSYGYGPGWSALGDSKMLQEMYRDYLTAEKMRIRPPVWMSTEARNVRSNLNPGGITYANSDLSARPIYQVQPDINGQMAAIGSVEQKVREAFFADLFLLNTGEQNRNMTAYEVEQRQREKLQLLGPVLERLNNELLDPLTGRTFNILWRSGKIPQPPDALIGSNITIEYVSPLAIAQKTSSASSLTMILQIAAGMAQADPAVMDNINTDKALTEYMRMTAVPASIIRTDDEIGEIRAARQQQQQQQMEAEQTLSAAEAAQKGATAANQMASAPLGGGSLLDGLISGGIATEIGGEAVVQ